MSLSILKYLMGHSFSGMDQNPYYFKLKYESLSVKTIDKFLDLVHPFFHGNSNEHAWGDHFTEDKDDDHKLSRSYEWELNQSSSTLLARDLTGVLSFCMPSPAIDFLRKWICFLDIYSGFDEWDEHVDGDIEKTNGSNESHTILLHAEKPGPGIRQFFSGFRMICYTLALKLLPGKNGSVSRAWMMGPVSMPVTNELSRARVPEASSYRIRGPSFIKNILLLFSNKRN
jgi:hypothetical protein